MIMLIFSAPFSTESSGADQAPLRRALRLHAVRNHAIVGRDEMVRNQLIKALISLRT